MKKLMRKMSQAALKAARRFFANKPANNYEKVVFTAVREVAITFGRAAMA